MTIAIWFLKSLFIPTENKLLKILSVKLNKVVLGLVVWHYCNIFYHIRKESYTLKYNE